MVSSLNVNDDAGRASSSQRGPLRGAEAIANFYGRYSTDHASVRAKNIESSLSSYAGSIRRSSSGTEFYSHAHSLNESEEAATLADGSTQQIKAPRVYNSFQAAAAAASRSSLNKRGSQNSLPSNAASSPSIRNSPSFSSPHVSSPAFGETSTPSSGGGAVLGLVSPSVVNKGNSFDFSSVNQYTPASLANTFPWLSANPATNFKQDRGSLSAKGRAIAQTKMDSPPVSHFSKGKGFGWNPAEDHRAPKLGTNIRPNPSASKVDMRGTRDAVGRGRGLGIKSSSELDLPERMRSQRKGALAPPRLSQDPIAISIEEELRPRSNVPPKTDSAFSRLGRAFRRKSKTGSDLKVDLNADAKDVPPLPKTPRRVPSQALSVKSSKPTDPFAAKALKAADPVPSLTKASMDAAHQHKELPDVHAQGSISADSSSKFLDSSTRQKGAVYSSDDRMVAQQPSTTSAKPSHDGRDAGRAPVTLADPETSSHLAQSHRAGTVKEAGQAAAMEETGIQVEDAKPVPEIDSTHADDQGRDDEEAKQVESATQLYPANADTVPLTTDSDYVRTGSDAALPSTLATRESLKRSTSVESNTSSAGRRSLAFLASAISMGAIAAEAEEEADSARRGDEKLGDALNSTTDSDAIDPSRPSLTSIPVTVSRTNSTSSTPRRTSLTEQTAPTFTSMSRHSSADRNHLEPKSATRNDQIPSILSDFLSMNSDVGAQHGKRGKSKVPSRTAHGDVTSDLSNVPLERSKSETSDGRKPAYSSSPKAARAVKGVFMSPPAGPSNPAFVSPFYVAPLTSVDSGLATRPSRASGRRASASSRSITSEDSRSVHSGSRRGSVPLAVPDSAPPEPETASTGRATEGNTDQAHEASAAEKARKVKSFGNLRGTANDQNREAMPRASTSRLPSASTPSEASTGGTDPASTSASTAVSDQSENSQDVSSSRSRGVHHQPLRRPKTSGAEAGPDRERSNLAPANTQGAAGSRRGSGPGRASLDDTGRAAKPYSSSTGEGDFETMKSRAQAATPTERQRSSTIDEMARVSASERRDSSAYGSRPSEQSTGAITPSSSRLETSGGAAALFGNPTTRPRTSSLLPSFGFSRSRTGSSAGLEGSGKSPGIFGTNARSASGGFWREASDPPTSSGGGTQPSERNGADRSPRASTSSRASYNRQLSAGTVLSIAESKQLSVKPEKKFSLSAFLPYDDEYAPEYADRIACTAPKTQVAAILASSPDSFYVDALHHFMARFWFNGLPLDIALRKLLMDLHLPKETQQIDRVMEAFAKRYNECNSGLFASDDQPYILSFSLMMLHTDAFNRNAKNKMTKVDYLRNTGSSGVPTEILEYLYDNLTFTQFIYIEDEEAGRRRPSEASGMSLTGPSASSSLATPGAAANNRTKIDPYYLITQGRLGELRPDLEHVIPEDTPFSYTGSLPNFDVDRLNSAFLHAPSIEIVTTKQAGDQSGTASPIPGKGEEEVVSLKVTKVGVVNRKDDVSDGGKKAASRKWKTSGLLLTGSQLLLFKDIIWINALQSQILDQVGHSLLCNGIPTEDNAAHEMVEGGVVISPRITYFRPDGVISLADAVAVKDHSYGKYDFVFRLLAAKGRQYLVQTQSEDDMNDWIHKINFCASFRTSNIKIRGLDLAPRAQSGSASQELDGLDPNDTLESRFGRQALSRTSFSDSDRPARGIGTDESGRSTPVPDEMGDSSRNGTLRPSVDPMSRNNESDGPPRPRSSASHRLSPASSTIQKRAKARRELMITKIAETEMQLERAATRLADEIRLARHFAILTPFLKSTRDRIEMSALPLASRIRALRLDVAKAEARCKILHLDLAAGERVARSLLPNIYLSSSAMRAANRMPSAQMATPQLLELGSKSDTQAQFEELFAPLVNGGGPYEPPTTAAGLSGTVKKPASHQRNQMNLNAVCEQPADESPVMPSRRQMADAEDDVEQEHETPDARKPSDSERPSSPSRSFVSASSAEKQERRVKGSAADEVPEEWDMSQVARPGTNRISLVDLPSPDELQEATGGRFRFGVRPTD
ncbi:uncharacterized protein MEPE_00163 [Melanopsichium pennsylvanicum]|uniref:Uncharacterized protein n=2 Tax=Melanopsichium pennsylvanicum TaxID=63383 RepID=A0AAJ4XHU2_9BASI|nr:arf guanyl-nucleotide exchange factor [Melanopsichium pennsylvanicum 4]SNX81458.1 uncharacterized protein MEPE_00163 [Melanopsichium pennsylvanicum]